MNLRKKQLILNSLIVLMALAVPLGCGNDDDDDDDQQDEAADGRSVEVIEAAMSGDPDGLWTGVLITEVLTPSDIVESAGIGDEDPPSNDLGNVGNNHLSLKSDEVSHQPEGDYWFAFVDMDPFAQFSHEVLYIFIDDETGEVVTETHEWWPEINGTAIYLTDKSVRKIYSPGTPPDDYQAPGTQSQSQGLLFAVEPDYDNNTVSAKLFVEASGNNGLYLNAVIDNNRDGFWGDSGQGAEWLVVNEMVETDSDWYVTQSFDLPLNSSNKFAYQNWTRISTSTETMDESSDWDGSGADNPKDYYFNFLPWGGPGYDAIDYVATAIGPDEPPFDPEPWDLKASWGEDGIWICEPDPIEIPIKKIALIINLGDSPGKSWMQKNAKRAEAGFKRLLGDDATQMLDRPKEFQAKAAILDLFSDMKCLDEVWLYITGHGKKSTGSIDVANWSAGDPNDGFLALWEVIAMLNQYSNCPNPNEYADDGCRQPGYCNVNFILQSCYSGKWLDDGSSSFLRHGVNALTSANADKPSYGRADGNGSYVSNAFWEGVLEKKADLEANGGNGDGEVTTQEAMEYAQNHHEGTNSESLTACHGNCDCNCEVPDTTTWTYDDSANDLFYWYMGGTPAYVGALDILTYGLVLAKTVLTMQIILASPLTPKDGTEFREYYWVFDADPGVANYDQTGPTEGADRAFIASYQNGNWYPFRFDYDGSNWTGGQDSNATLNVSGDSIEYVIDLSATGLDFTDGLPPYMSATWYRENGTQGMDVGDVGEWHQGDPK